MEILSMRSNAPTAVITASFFSPGQKSPMQLLNFSSSSAAAAGFSGSPLGKRTFFLSDVLSAKMISTSAPRTLFCFDSKDGSLINSTFSNSRRIAGSFMFWRLN